jgi:AcrR family transcriptional regulator
MGRRRTIPDADIFAAIRRLLAEGGDKAVAFSSVARATGLAAPSLVQRYGSRDGMVRQALLAAWDDRVARLREAAEVAPLTRKGAAQLLKQLGEGDPFDPALHVIDLRDAELRARAEVWRAEVEAALALRLGGGAKGREAAAMLFAAWQGQLHWATAGGRGLRLRDIVRRIG